MSAFELGSRIDLTSSPYLQLFDGSAANEHRHNVDGYIGLHKELGYVQVFRSGVIELVDRLYGASTFAEQPKSLPSVDVEAAVVNATAHYVQWLERLGATAPFFVGMSLLDVKGVEWDVRKNSPMDIMRPPIFDRDVIVLPEVTVETGDERRWSARLKPLLDSIWQAAGRSKSQYFDDDGKWRLDATK